MQLGADTVSEHRQTQLHTSVRFFPSTGTSLQSEIGFGLLHCNSCGTAFSVFSMIIVLLQNFMGEAGMEIKQHLNTLSLMIFKSYSLRPKYS